MDLFGIVPKAENLFEMRFNPVTSLAKAVGPLHGCGNLPLYQVLQRVVRNTIDNRIAGPDDAGLLVERLGSLRDGRAIEFSQSFYRGDTHDFVAKLSASTGVHRL